MYTWGLWGISYNSWIGLFQGQPKHQMDDARGVSPWIGNVTGAAPVAKSGILARSSRAMPRQQDAWRIFKGIPWKRGLAWVDVGLLWAYCGLFCLILFGIRAY